MAVLVSLMACGNNPGESGAVDDGFEGAGDPSGGVAGDTVIQHTDTATDTAAFGKDRVDTEKRDSAAH